MSRENRDMSQEEISEQESVNKEKGIDDSSIENPVGPQLLDPAEETNGISAQSSPQNLELNNEVHDTSDDINPREKPSKPKYITSTPSDVSEVISEQNAQVVESSDLNNSPDDIVNEQVSTNDAELYDTAKSQLYISPEEAWGNEDPFSEPLDRSESIPTIGSNEIVYENEEVNRSQGLKQKLTSTNKEQDLHPKETKVVQVNVMDEAKKQVPKNSDVDPEASLLSNLTAKQLQSLQEEKENEIKECKYNIDLIRMDIENLEGNGCQATRPLDIENDIRLKRKQLSEEEIYLEKLKERAAVLKSVKSKYKHFPVSKLPQVILFSTGCDKMPKIAVCSRPKESEPKNNELNSEFKKCFTPDQWEKIEGEQRWAALEFGKIQLQIAGVKGKLRVVERENNSLRAIIEENPPKEEPLNIVLPENHVRRLPCQRRKGKSGETLPCPKFAKSKRRSLPTLAITIDSAALDLASEPMVYDGDQNEELEDIAKKADELQSALDKATEKSDTLKALQGVLGCVKESLK